MRFRIKYSLVSHNHNNEQIINFAKRENLNLKVQKNRTKKKKEILTNEMTAYTCYFKKLLYPEVSDVTV